MPCPHHEASSTQKASFLLFVNKAHLVRVFSIAPLADALHEQDSIRLKKFALYSGQEEVLGTKALSPTDELQAAKNRSYWRVGSQLDKRPHYKGTLEVGQGIGCKTREMELIWWPDLFPNTKHGKLGIRFYVKKVFM